MVAEIIAQNPENVIVQILKFLMIKPKAQLKNKILLVVGLADHFAMYSGDHLNNGLVGIRTLT